MTDFLDPSPRASKRRRTATYKAAESGLKEGEHEQHESQSASKAAEGEKQTQNQFEDSAYGSKEDSLVEEEGSAIAGKYNGLNPDHKRNDSHAEQMVQGQVVKKPERAGTSWVTTVDSKEDNADDTIAVQTRSSGRERRRPRRYSLSPEEPRPKKPFSAAKSKKQNNEKTSEHEIVSNGQTTPKGILTPSRKGKRLGPRKSVLFNPNEKEIEQRFGFKDIQETVEKSSRTVVNNAEDAQEQIVVSPRTPSRQSRSKSNAQLTPDAQIDGELEEIQTTSTNLTGVDVEPIDIDFDNNVISTTITDDDPTNLALKRIVLARLVGTKSTSIPMHLQSQYDALYSLLRATIISGESNSLLLLGARGAGKSHLINAATTDLASKHLNDFHTVRLNGFYQTDDRLALREIWRQLGREMQVEEMENGELGGSYADTMSSLLSLLSHPDDFDSEVQATNDASLQRTSKSVLFILDEFDLFTTHPRQTLLYNLFDIAQSRKAPIAVIGCSTRVDVVDCLEKRVKSRFSHRWLHIPSVKTLDGFTDIVKNVLCVEKIPKTESSLFIKDAQATEAWNQYIQTVFLQNLEIQDLIKRTFYMTKSIADLFIALYTPIAILDIRKSAPQLAINADSGLVSSSFDLGASAILLNLPTIQLSLLIAASRLDTIHNLTTLNFNLVYAHYVELISRSKLQVTASGAVAVGAALRQWSRETAQSAWQDLGLSECIMPVSGGIGAGNKDNGSAGIDNAGGEGASVRMWRVEVTLEEIEWSIRQRWKESGGARDVLTKWCKEI